MTTAELLEHLRAEALKLPAAERRALVESLQDSLDDDDGELDPAYAAELQRRIAGIDDGTSTGLSLDEVRARMRARFGG